MVGPQEQAFRELGNAIVTDAKDFVNYIDFPNVEDDQTGEIYDAETEHARFREQTQREHGY